MILFQPRHVQPILDGTKTQTRRFGARRWLLGAEHQCRTQIFGGKPFAIVRIEDVRSQRLGDMTPEEARAEGGYNLHGFADVWKEIHGIWLPEVVVWVVEFKLSWLVPDPEKA